jgi:hypothetical protein
MTTKDKFIQLSVIHSTKREEQTIIGLTAAGRLFKGVITDTVNQDTTIYTWKEINLPEELK